MSSSPTDATVAVAMPQMGVSVAEGTIVEWRKSPGDWVEADETICDVSTDKIDVEIPSPAAGRLARIVAAEGETVSVGATIAEIDPNARPGEAHPDEDHPEAEEAAGGAGEAAAADPGAAEHEADRSRVYSPVVRRIAAEHGIDLERVEGHGVGGRVRKSDLVAWLREHERAGGSDRPLHTESPYRPEEPPVRAAEAPPPEPSGADSAAGEELVGPTRREPLTPMRREIGAHMLRSRATAAHATTVMEVDFAAASARREELAPEMERRGVHLTWLGFVAEATVAALAEHPVLNASLDGDQIVYHEDVNLSIAVAIESGLIVPVIRRAQRLSLEGLAAAISDVAKRARSGELEPDDLAGGTFTLTNPGRWGATLATPIINQPQVAILDLEAVTKRVTVIEGPSGDSVTIRPLGNLCLSWDHRALDGVEAARFLGAIRERLESAR